MNIQEYAKSVGCSVGEISDGYHTYNDLYNQRLHLFATIVNLKPTMSWKSKKHADGELCFGGGWFVVGVNTPEGQYSYHYELKDWDLFKCEELDVAPEWDGHTSQDVARVLSLVKEPSSWAQEEVNRAIKRELQISDDGEEDYGLGFKYSRDCYLSALKAYNSLEEDNHSGFSISITKNILNQLIEQRPLTPVTGTEDEWVLVSTGPDVYQNKRYSSLFKNIMTDGTTSYNDTNQFIITDVDYPNVYYTSSFIAQYVKPFFPITMPYSPSSNSVKIYTKQFLVDPVMGSYDTIGIIKAVREGEEPISINKFFKEVPLKGFVEISEQEYNERLSRKIN